MIGARATTLTALGCLALAGCSGPSSPPVGDESPVVWSVAAQTAATAPMITESSVIFGGGDGAVQARARADGALLWREVLISGYRPRGDQVVAGGGFALVPMWDLWALDPTTGEIRWRFGGPDGAAGTRTPVVSGDTIFTASALGWASAVDARSGAPIWTVDLEEALFTPALSNELVIYGTRGFSDPEARSGGLGAGHLIALNRENGSEAWRVPIPDSVGFPRSGGAVSGGVVWADRIIVGSKAAWVYAFDLRDGTLLWSAPNGGSPVVAGYTTAPALVDGVVVIGQANDRIDGWDALSGELLWSWQQPSLVASLVGRGSLIYAIQGPITIGDRTGSVLWEFGWSDPQDFDGHTYFRADVAPDGTIYALRAGPFVDSGTAIVAVRPPIRP